LKKRNKYKKTRRVLIGAAAATALIFVCAAGCSSGKQAENEEAYRQIGLNNLQSGEYAEAVEAFDQALAQRIGRISDMEIDICYYKALAQFKNGDIEDCLATYTALIEYDDKNAEAYFLRGSVYLNQQKNKEALADFAAAVKADDKNYQMYIEIADALAAAGDSENEQIYLNQAQQIGGKDAESLRYQGIIALRQGKTDEALKNLTAALNDGDDESSLELGKVYMEQKDAQKASEMFRAYLEKHKEDTEVINQLGCMAAEDGDYDTAITYFEQGLSVENAANKRELMKNEIAAYENKGDFQTAKTKMEEYLQSYPEDETAQREAVFLQTR
jgi:Tfp pilus assembly protein PilF